MPNHNTYPLSADFPRATRDIVRKGMVEAVNGKRVRVRIGEQVTIASENGNLNTGVVTGSINSDAYPLPDDCGENDLILETPPGGRLVLRCGQSVIELTAFHIKISSPRIDSNEE